MLPLLLLLFPVIGVVSVIKIKPPNYYLYMAIEGIQTRKCEY